MLRMDRGDLEQVVLKPGHQCARRDAEAAFSDSTRGSTEGPDGRPPGEHAAADRWLVLEVKDNGVGMDAETQSHVFEPFFTTKPKDRGSGLGLSTIYGIVRSHGGVIGLRASGGGSTFRVHLPDAASELGDGAGPELRHQPGSETVLIMEDEPAVRDLAARVLTRQGYSVVIQAGTGWRPLPV